jgi:hypothetical protein
MFHPAAVAGIIFDTAFDTATRLCAGTGTIDCLDIFVFVGAADSIVGSSIIAFLAAAIIVAFDAFVASASGTAGAAACNSVVFSGAAGAAACNSVVFSGAAGAAACNSVVASDAASGATSVVASGATSVVAFVVASFVASDAAGDSIVAAFVVASVVASDDVVTETDNLSILNASFTLVANMVAS